MLCGKFTALDVGWIALEMIIREIVNPQQCNYAIIESLMGLNCWKIGFFLLKIKK